MAVPTGRDPLLRIADFERAVAGSVSPVAVFKDALRNATEALEGRYWSQPRQVARVVADHAWLIDQLLAQAWRHWSPRLPSGKAAALIAVGGYGRGELHPASDIDLLILLDRDKPESFADFVEHFVRFLWDIGLQVGHSVRNIKDCVREAKDDITVATNLMEARHLCGDESLIGRMQDATHASRIWPSRKFFAAKWQEQVERHRHFDDTAYNLEPNVKEGPGGLRDIQMIAWVTQRHFDTNSLHDLVRKKFLQEDEYRALIRGRNFLWQVRSGLHYLAHRREDRLLFDHQRSLARAFGFRDKRGILAVEQFMKRYYRTIKELSLLNEILLQHLQEAILSSGRMKVVPVNRRFRLHGGFLEVTNPRVFERSPFALLEMFLVLEQNPACKGVRAATIRLLRTNLRRIDNRFRRDIACRSLFMEILRQPQGITHALRRMNAYGVLGAYVRAFGKVVGQMQHDLFHVYTVDEHTLFVLRNLRRFTVPAYRHEFPLASELIQHVAKPERLYLAALFHDIAKGRGGDHSELGEADAERFCRLHNLSDYDTRFVKWLVRHHLIMSWTSQHTDVQDPDVVMAFAQKVGDQEHLDHLYLLTVADMRGTSPKVWNEWKGKLLSQLYDATSQVLRRGLTTPVDLEAHVADLREQAEQLLAGDKLDTGALARFWTDTGDDYVLRYTAESLAWHAQSIVGPKQVEHPIVATRYNPDIGGTEFLIYTPDRRDLFVILTAGFDRMNLSIVDARIHTTQSGFALDTFVVLDHNAEPVREPRALSQLKKEMQEQLRAPQPGRDSRAAHLSRTLKHFPIVTRISFNPELPRGRTIMEVVSQDRPGLLYGVALALQRCGVNLAGAKVSTFGERAEDFFFLSTTDNRAIEDAATLDCLQAEIKARLDGRPSTEPGEVSSISL